MSEQTAEQLVAEIRKNDREVIRVSRTTYNGKELLDVRVWVVPAKTGGEGKPTKKGLTLRPETWSELAMAVMRSVLAEEIGAHEAGLQPPCGAAIGGA
jgi:glutamate/tyrosine decarboxylase-like PLP-dependent enzyme